MPIVANPAINFYLSALDSTVDLSAATIQSGNAPDNNASVVKAVAHMWVDASSVRNVFKFASNSADLTDVSGEDMRFFVDAAAFGNLVANTTSSSGAAGAPVVAGSTSGLLKEQVGLAYVEDATKNSARAYNVDAANVQYSVDNKGLIKDLFRDLAHQLFKTQYGVDIFNNETDLCNNTASTLKSLFVSGGGIYSALNTANNKDTGMDTSANIGFTLLKSIVSNDRERLADLSGSTSIYVDASSGFLVAQNAPGAGSNVNNIEMRLYKMPLLASDSIRFQVKCIYAASQTSVIELSSTLEDRNYEIVLHLE